MLVAETHYQDFSKEFRVLALKHIEDHFAISYSSLEFIGLRWVWVDSGKWRIEDYGAGILSSAGKPSLVLSDELCIFRMMFRTIMNRATEG